MATSNQENSSLLSQILASHGGLAAFSKFDASTFKFNLAGGVLAIKGLPDQYQLKVRVSTDTTVPRTEIQGMDLEHPTDTWIFTHDRVWTQSTDGTIKQSRTSPREGYKSRELHSQWDQLNFLYFMGYALWNYTTIPFAFAAPGFEMKEVEEHWEPGYLNSNGVAESWRVLEVHFPDNYDTHSKVQKMYFDREKLWVRRMDYVAEVAGGIAAHYCFDHKVVKGIVVPMLRRVVSRVPGTSTSLVTARTGFLLNYFDVDLVEKVATGGTEEK